MEISMSGEEFYKYVILRDRDGKFLLPYSGAMGLSDVAFTGSYKDLLDKPNLSGSVPATFDVNTGKYNIEHPIIFNDKLILGYKLDFMNGNDLANEFYIVTEDYVYDVAHYLVDSLKKITDDAYTEASKPGSTGENYKKTFKGAVLNKARLLSDEIPMNLYDVIYVIEECTWYMCVNSSTGVKTWVSTYNGKAVTP